MVTMQLTEDLLSEILDAAIPFSSAITLRTHVTLCNSARSPAADRAAAFVKSDGHRSRVLDEV